MKPAPFTMVRPASIAEALDALDGSDGETKALAGGQSLVPLLSMRLATPTTLVDLNTLPDLVGVDSTAVGRVRFGAMTRQSALINSPEHGLIAEAAGWIGHSAIRSRGTLGGSVAHADPSAELPCASLACNAAMTLASADGQRYVDADDFFAGPFQTAIADNELLTAVEFDVPVRWGFQEFARRDGDFALVLAIVAELTDGWRVVIGGVGPAPWRCHAAEAALTGGATSTEVATAVADTVEPFDDLHAGADYRRALAAHVAGHAATDALATEHPGEHR